MPSWNIRLTGLHPGPRQPTPNVVRVDNKPNLEAAKTAVIQKWSKVIGRPIQRAELSGYQIDESTSHFKTKHQHSERIVSGAERSLPRGDQDD